ncbi:MAG TPA: hypothetical protein VIN58_25725 [Roseateles sp.]
MNPHVDIDALIDEAERRLIRREARWRRDVKAFGHQLHEAARPARLIRPVLVAGAVAAVLLWWPKKSRSGPAPAASQQQAAAPLPRPALFALLAGIPWTRVLSHAWPMLPDRWRERLNPATAASLLTFGLPLLERFIARRRPSD